MIQSICLLGSFRVRADSSIRISKKGKALLALLAIAALDGEGMSRQRLSMMLWPYQDSERGRHSLRNCLMELRKALRAEAVKTLITDFVNCRLDMPTDVADFARLEKSNSQHDLELAAELYRGDLLDDLAITSEPFDEWLAIQRDLWRQRAMEVLSRLSTTLRRDRKVMTKVLVRLEYHIDTRHVGMKSLEAMRDLIKRRLEDEHLAAAPRPQPQSNGEVGVELRA